MQIKNWFQKAVTTLLDADREPRIVALTNAIQHAINVQGKNFSIQSVAAGTQCNELDLREASKRIYRGALERGWADGTLTQQEQNIAKWLATKLMLRAEETRVLDFEQARKWFGMMLAQAMEDGILDDQEHAKLEAIARAVGCTIGEFARAFFTQEGEAFLRSIFLACVADNQISQNDWAYLLHVTKSLGFEQHEMLSAVQPQARQFVEHVLADCKSDGQIAPQEQRALEWLLQNLQLPPYFCRYVRSEIELLQAMANIAIGRLPSLQMPQGMEYRSGEIVHWHGSATWHEVKARKHGPQVSEYHGTLVFTDNRLIFSSTLKSHTVNYRKVVSHRGGQKWLEIQPESKPVSRYHLHADAPTAYPILQMAIAMANQTKVAQVDGEPTRHIPRDVRQRVWQKYGGRCAECSATEYLEFDHIIPHVRGGSNADGNVQLLCRMCNNKKSDHI
jgi:tellurite resistance protein